MSYWSLLKARYGNADDQISEVRIDQSTDSLQIVDYHHHEIHAGKVFRVQAFDDEIAAGETLTIGFRTGDVESRCHMTFDYVAESKCTAKLWEGVSISGSTGTDVAIKNSRRDKQDVYTSQLQGYATGTWTSGNVTKNPTWGGGETISLKKIYSDAGFLGGGGGEGTRRNEIILASGTQYVFELTNDDTSTEGGQLRMEWYEHTDKH